MNQSFKLTNLLDLIFQGGVILLTLSIPFLFWNLTTEFYETPKFLFLAVLTGVLIIVWLLRFVAAGRVSITRTPLDLPFLLLLVVLAVSTFFTQSLWVSIFGNLPRIHGGLSAFVVYILLYFVLVSNLRSVSFSQKIVYLLLLSGVVLSVISILTYFGIQVLPLEFTKGLNFTPTGSSFSTTSILALLLPFPLLSLLRQSKDDALVAAEKTVLTNLHAEKSSINPLSQLLSVIILLLFGTTIVLIGSLPTYVAALTALGLVAFATPQKMLKQRFFIVLIPLILVILLAVLSFSKAGGMNNPLYTKAQNFPREIQLPIATSWKVSVSAFRDSPFWGTGPATYLADFTQYKPIEFNQTKFWNVRFDLAFNEYLQFLATFGALGLISLLLLTAIVVSLALKSLSSSEHNISRALAISCILIFVLLALHTSTLPMIVVGILILALFMAVHKNNTEELHIGLSAAKNEGGQYQIRFDALPLILLIIIVAGLCFVYYKGGRFTLADFYHRQALNEVAKNEGANAYTSLQKAETLNPYADIYRTDISQINFALANSIAKAKGPSESSPSGSLTDQDKQTIQQLLSQSITEGRVAVALNPNNPANWEVLGSIYRQIAGVAQNALSFSLDSYGRAIARDPLNPILRLNVGGIYYSIKNYDLAIRFFSDAVTLKPDYANGFFNLAIALREKGDIQGAVLAAEKTVSLLAPESQDHQVATQLLSQLKDKAKKSAEASSSANLAPASETDSALGQENLPQVLDLPEPENIATPEAIKKPSPTPEPEN